MFLGGKGVGKDAVCPSRSLANCIRALDFISLDYRADR